jgi:hypothetical protein
MKIFKTNQNTPERVLRFILAIFLIPAPFVLEQTIYTQLICALGSILLMNALIGTCYIYRMLGIDTCKL